MTQALEQTTVNPSDVIKALGLTIEAKFIPFSQSRNKADKVPNLNWLVTLKKDGREVLTTDYMAGSAHAPSYKQFQNKFTFDMVRKFTFDMVRAECEQGYKMNENLIPIKKLGMIEPKIEDVVYSLVMDSDVLESRGFEDWASNLGYDTDSRKAEAIFKACLEHALKLRAALGNSALDELRMAFQDY